MTITLNGSGTIDGITAGGLPDNIITDADIVSLDGGKLTGSIPAAQMYAGLNATGSAPIYACRAWVNFNGAGTVAIRASGNVSSITDNGTGNYIVNFTTAMPDANYAAPTAGGDTASGLADDAVSVNVFTKTTASVRLYVGYLTSGGNISFYDYNQIDLAIFR